jgi:hypothetical protein
MLQISAAWARPGPAICWGMEIVREKMARLHLGAEKAWA